MKSRLELQQTSMRESNNETQQIGGDQSRRRFLRLKVDLSVSLTSAIEERSLHMGHWGTCTVGTLWGTSTVAWACAADKDRMITRHHWKTQVDEPNCTAQRSHLTGHTVHGTRTVVSTVLSTDVTVGNCVSV